MLGDKIKIFINFNAPAIVSMGFFIMGIIIILGLIVTIELELRPRIDVTVEKDVLLWWGKYNRKFIKLFKF